MLKELKVDTGKCVHCRTCLDVCFKNVIEWDEERGIPYGKYPLDCQICCICESACPAGAIEVIPDWNQKYYPRYVSGLGEVK